MPYDSDKNAAAQARWREKRNALAKRAEELEAEVAKLRALQRRDRRRLAALVKLHRIDEDTMRAIFEAADKGE
jgi:hypothetical protein